MAKRDRHPYGKEGAQARPDPGTRITRRTFLHRCLLGGAAAGISGLFPVMNTMDMAVASSHKGGGMDSKFRFAWISDTHLYPRDVNERFVDKTVRAIEDVKAMDPAPDFLIFGGDLAQLGDPVELRLGKELLDELEIKKFFIPGEHDWYLDMGETWNELFGTSPWYFDHQGVRFIGLDTVSRAIDYWSATNMSAKERMAHMAALDSSVVGAWAAVGDKQLQWLEKNLSGLSKDAPIVIFSHNPLYEYYPPWNFWVRDWRAVHEVLGQYSNVTNLHGHTHQPLYNEIGKVRSIGMLATAWPWPYAPEGVPELTDAMVRPDPGNHFDGVGWDKLQVMGDGHVENEYMMWREEVFASNEVDSGTGDNDTQELHPRVSDRMWPY